MKSYKMISALLILSMIALIFSGCGGSGGGNFVTPPPPDEPLEPIIPETTNIIDEETIGEITSITGDQGTIIFKKPTPQLEGLALGDIIAMGVTENTPEGLLRKVTNITKGEKDSSEIIVETEFAALEEAIEQGEFYFNEALKAKDAKEPVYYVKGVEFIRDKSTIRDSKIQLLEFIYNINAIIYDEDKNPNTEEDNITLTGQISFNYNLLLSGKITFFQLKELNYQNIVEVKKNLGVTVGGSLKFSPPDTALFTQDLGIKIISIGCCFPVILHPKITIIANIDGEIFAKLTAEVTDTDIYTAGIQFDNGNWQPISSHEDSHTPPSLSLSAGGAVTFGVGPKLECKVDGVVGPYCETILYGKVIADIYTNPWWKIYAGIIAKAGVKIEIFSKVFASADMIILDLQKILKQADGPFGGTNHPPVISTLTADPSSVDINQTTTITCIASDPDDDALTYVWTKTGGTFEGSITGPTITWRAPSTEGNYTVSCEVSDGEASDSDQVIISVGDVNHAPVITSTAVTSATVGQVYNYDVSATDSDGDILGYSLTTKPSGMTINSTTGMINWAPTATGNFNVTVKVSDGELSDTQSFTVIVEESGTTTRIIRLVGDLNFGSVQVGSTSQKTLTIYNDGNSTLTVSSISYPTGFSGNWSGNISAGSSRNITLIFAPTQAIAYSGTLTVNSDKTSGTNTKSVSGVGTSTPVPPTGFSVSSYWNTVSPGFPSMNLSWNAVSGATGYEMWVRPSGGSYASLGTRDAPYVTFNSNSLPGGARYVSGTTYYFKVRTVTASGTSDFTSEVPCVAVAAPSTYPSAPTSLSPGTTSAPGPIISTLTPTLQWQAVPNADYYNLSVSIYPYGTSNIIYYNQQIYGNSITVPSGELEAGNKYRWNMRAYNSAGYSDYSSDYYFQTGTTLGQVQLSSPGNGVTLPPMSVTFIWNPVSNATKYQFILYNQQGQVALDTVKTSTFLIVALGTEETITWKVRAGDNSGNWGAWSSIWSLTIKNDG